MSAFPPDEGQREQIRGAAGAVLPVTSDPHIVLDRNLVVRAGAGSGKTRSLVERIVALVRTGVEMRHIAAITFTIKAAAELRLRVYRSLREQRLAVRDHMASPDCVERHRVALTREADRLRIAERMVEQAFIGTVHSFCGRIVRERPFEAGLSPDFVHLDPSRVMEHRRAFWARAVADPSRAWVERFHHLGLDPADLFDHFSLSVDHEDVQPSGIALQPPQPVLSGAAKAILELADEVRPFAAKALADDKVLPMFRRIDAIREIGGLHTVRRQAALLRAAQFPVKAATGKADITMVRWGLKGTAEHGFANTLRDRLAVTRTEVVDPALRAWYEYVWTDVASFVNETVHAYSMERRERGELTFDDLLLCARDTLATSPRNRAFFQGKFRRILVDEFQDTDPVQAEVLLLLTAQNREQRNPWRCRPQPGSLVIVGDDKQSIYRFRRADVDVFRRFEQVLLEEGGSRVALTTNFRSHASICQFVNVGLRDAFPASGARQAVYEDLVPHLEPSARTHSHQVLRLSVDGASSKHASAVSAFEAPRIADAIASLVRDGSIPLSDGSTFQSTGRLGYGDILVLYRSSSQMTGLVSCLGEREIPYSIAGGKTLRRSESLRLLLDPLDALANDDPVAATAFLRGPFCGVSDRDLADYVARGGRLKMPLRGGNGQVMSVATGAELLSDLADRIHRCAPSEAIDGWVEEWGLIPALALGPGGAGSAGSLVRVLSLIKAWSHSGLSWPDVVTELHRLEAGDIESEQLTLDALEGDTVQLMTVHQAKGLESPVVFLGDPHRTDVHPPTFHVDRSVSPPALSATIGSGVGTVARAPGWDAAFSEESAEQTAEELRLTYVASTRASELLVVSGAPWSSGSWSVFESGAAALPAIEPNHSGRSAPRPSVPIDELEEAIDSIPIRIQTLATSSYHLKTPSAEATDHQASEGGLGVRFGRVVHRLFERMVRLRDDKRSIGRIRDIAEALAEDEAAAADRARFTDEAVRAFLAFRASPVWKDVMRADEVHAEMPFSWTDTAAGIPVATSGTMDLVYRVGTSWYVVDYKTDAVPRSTLLTRHTEQARAYHQAIHAATGADSIRVRLWSTHHELLVGVPLI